jgi:hypothetical protein
MVHLRLCGSAERVHILYGSQRCTSFCQFGSAGRDYAGRRHMGSPPSHRLDSRADDSACARRLDAECVSSAAHLASAQPSGGAVETNQAVASQGRGGAGAICSVVDHAGSDRPGRDHALQDFSPFVERAWTARDIREAQLATPGFGRCVAGPSCALE